MTKVTIDWHVPVSGAQKWNPIWWLMNVDDPSPPQDYDPTYPTFVRYLFWYMRNPLHNLTCYVLGVCDRNYDVYSKDPPLLNVLLDIGETGWYYSMIKINTLVWLPYVSYSGTKVVWYVGWQPTGKLGAKFNLI